MDRLQGMNVFVRVVESSSFSKAAERLNMSTTAVSRSLAQLEEHLGARLLNRSTRRLSLTDMGRAYYERCVLILADLAEAEAIVGSAAAELSGVLKVNIPVSFGILHLAPVLPDYTALYPKLSLDVSLSDRMVDLVEEGYDLAVRISANLHTTLVARAIAPIRIVACASPAYLAKHGEPQVPEDLTRHNCLTYSYMSNRNDWLFIGDNGPQNVTVKGTVHTNNGDIVRAAALAGRGIILQPTFLVGEDLRRGRLKLLLPQYRLPELWMYVVYPSRRLLSAKVRAFVDFLVARFGGEPYWDEWMNSTTDDIRARLTTHRELKQLKA